MSEPVAERLTAAIAAAETVADWGPVLDILRDDWSELFQDSPRLLLDVLASLPATVIAQNPRLRLADQYLRRAVEISPETSAYADIISDDPNAQPLDRLAALTGRIAVARNAGRYLDAVAATDVAVSTLGAMPVDVIPAFANALPEFHYHWGLAYLLVSRFDDALNQLVKSFDWAASVGNRIVQARSAGAAALIHALHGRGRHASDWLGKVPVVPSDAWWASEASTPARLCEAILHTERLEPDAARVVLAGIDIGLSMDYWGPYYAIRAFLTPDHPGDAQALLSEFDSFVGGLSPEYASVPLNSEYSMLVRFILFERLRQPERAVGALGKLDVDLDEKAGVIRQTGATLQALRLLRLGQRTEARALVKSMLHASSAHPRVLLPALLIAAETDPPRHRAVSLQRAVALAVWNRCHAALALGPASQREQIAELLRERGEPAVAERLLEVVEGTPVAGTDALTKQENAVVRAALAGQSNVEIAATHHVSVNTVKTHLRKAYRKLGVSTRKQLRLLFEHGSY